MPDPVYEIHGHYDDAYLITRAGKIVGCFYAEPGMPGWWRGHVNGRGVRELYVPGGDVDPLEVAARFLPGVR